MDINQWSFVLSIIGLILGFISAYTHLKNFSIQAIEAGNNSAELWLERKNFEADFYLANTTSFIAFITYKTILCILIICTGLYVSRCNCINPELVPNWTRSLIALIIAFVASNIVSSLFLTCRHIIRRAKEIKNIKE